MTTRPTRRDYEALADFAACVRDLIAASENLLTLDVDPEDDEDSDTDWWGVFEDAQNEALVCVHILNRTVAIIDDQLVGGIQTLIDEFVDADDDLVTISELESIYVCN